MEIKTYNKEQLNDLIRSDYFGHMPVLPISSHRAISQIRNPRAETDDIIMIIAYEGEEMLGYLGVLPDRIYNTSGEVFRCGWLSCMWVNPLLRGQGIAKSLLTVAFQNWNEHILVTEFTAEAKRLYDRSGNFTDLRIIDGLRCYLRFNLHEVLPKKNRSYKPYSSAIRLFDNLMNIPVDLRLSLIKTNVPAQVIFELIPQGGNLPFPYISSKQKNDLERRNADDMTWIIEYPWIKESKPTAESLRYHFSSVSERFINLRFRLMEAGQLKGYLHFTIRDNQLKVPYAYFDQDLTAAVVHHIYRLMMQYKLNMLTVFHGDLVAFLQVKSSPFIYKRELKRHFIISKTLAARFSDKENMVIRDGDADCAFT